MPDQTKHSESAREIAKIASDAFQDFDVPEGDFDSQERAFIDHLALLIDAKLPKWIPVSERLPKVLDFILTYRPFGGSYSFMVASIERDPKISDTGFVSPIGDVLHGVTHWMPLPAPPQTEETR